MAKEKEKKDKNNFGGKLLVTVLIVLLFGVFLGFGFALGGVNIINKVKSDDDVVTTGTDKVDTKDNAKYTEIPVDSMIENLYERTKAISIGIDKTRYTNKKLLVSEMSDEYKGLIAANYFYKYDKFIPLGGSNYKHTIDEQAVKYGYDSIFGAGTYKTGQPIYTGCGNYTYDSARNEYFTNQDGCGGTSAQAAIEEILKAEKNAKELKVTTVVYYASQEGSFKTFEDMTSSSNAITNYEEGYALKNKDSLQQITYTFEIDTNGFYKYVGFERTQEAK